MSVDFTNIYLHQHIDVRLAITDFSIYIIAIGLLLNIVFLVRSKGRSN